MNRSDLIAEIADRQNIPASTVEEVLDAFTSITTERLQQGEQVAIRTFGKFVPRVRKPVVRMNPRNQEPISVPETRSVGFVPSLKLKERLNTGDWVPKFSGRPQTYDRDALHSFLFRHANSRGVIKVHQRLLAEELGCSPTTLRTLLWELKLLNKIERVVGPGPCAHYKVNEPEKKARSAQKKKSRTPMWG